MEKDLQGRAYEDAHKNPVTDEDLYNMFIVGKLTPPNELEPIKTPEEYEADNWDEGRVGPKSEEEADRQDEEGVEGH